MTTPAGRVGNIFAARPRPGAVFQIEPRYLSCIGVGVKEGKIRGSYIHPLPSGVIEPRFDRMNIIDTDALRNAVKEGAAGIGGVRGPVALLIPETSAHVFVFRADAVPQKQAELASFIRWKLAKLVPGVAEDALVSFDLRDQGPRTSIIAAAVKRAVVREYEAVFEEEGLEPGFVSLPSLGLLNCHLREEGNVLLVNIESDHISLIALEDFTWAFYRQKIMNVMPVPEREPGEVIGLLAGEIETTMRYLADREKLRIDRVCLRAGAFEVAGRMKSGLAGLLSVPVDASGNEPSDRFLPLMGMIG